MSKLATYLKNYVEACRWRCRDALGTHSGFLARFPADHIALRLTIDQNWWTDRPYLCLAWHHMGKPLTSHVSERSRRGGSIRIPLLKRWDLHAEEKRQWKQWDRDELFPKAS